MGRGSFANRGGGSGGGAMQDIGIKNGMIEASGVVQGQIDDIVDSIKPNSSGLVPFGAMDKAGASLNKMMEVGDQLVITYQNGGDQRIYEKTGKNSFRQGQFTYNPTNIGNEIAAAKYPNPNLPVNKITVTINRKLSQAQQNAADSIVNRVKQIKGTGLKFAINADRTINFQYKNSQGSLVTGGINKNGIAKIMQVFGGTQGGF